MGKEQHALHQPHVPVLHLFWYLQSSGGSAGPGLTFGPSGTPGYLTLPKSALTEHIFSEDTGFYTQGGKHEQLVFYIHGP